MINPFERPAKVDPFARTFIDATLVDSKSDAPWVVLERIEPGEIPDYCTHGRVPCFFCDDWCWLGDKTFELVRAGDASPICIQCATVRFPPDSTPYRRVEDHRRADGPHGS